MLVECVCSLVKEIKSVKMCCGVKLLPLWRYPRLLRAESSHLFEGKRLQRGTWVYLHLTGPSCKWPSVTKQQNSQPSLGWRTEAGSDKWLVVEFFHTSFQLPCLTLAPSPYLRATITWQPFTWAAWSHGPHHGPVCVVCVCVCMRESTFRAEEGCDGRAVSLNMFRAHSDVDISIEKNKKGPGWQKWLCFVNLSEREKIRHQSVRSETRTRERDTL